MVQISSICTYFHTLICVQIRYVHNFIQCSLKWFSNYRNMVSQLRVSAFTLVILVCLHGSKKGVRACKLSQTFGEEEGK